MRTISLIALPIMLAACSNHPTALEPTASCKQIELTLDTARSTASDSLPPCPLAIDPPVSVPFPRSR